MIAKDYDAFRKHFEQCRKQLTDFQQKAPPDLQPKINIAISSLAAAEKRFEENGDVGEILYLLGRVHWTIGFVSGHPKEKPAKTLAEVFAEEKDETDETPILDKFLQS